ncbi:tyrosine-type recombinase/integrase [Nocardia beijingensis]
MLSETGDAEADAAFDVDLVAGRIDPEKALYRVGGTPLEPRNVNRAFAQLVKKADARPIRLHDLRHSCATLLFTMGVEAATVQRILRHSSITVTTGTYMDVIDAVQRDAVTGMGALFE